MNYQIWRMAYVARAVCILFMIGMLIVCQTSFPVQARTSANLGVQVSTLPDGVHVAWHGSAWHNDTDDTHVSATWSLVEIDGYRVPAHLIALRVTDPSAMQADGVPPITIDRVEHVAWAGDVMPADIPTIQTADGAEWQPIVPSSTERAHPSAPIFVLRDGYMRSQHIVVVAITRLFVQEGQTHALTGLQARIPGTQHIAHGAAGTIGTIGTIGAIGALSTQTGNPHLQGTPDMLNPITSQHALKVQVKRAGIQRVIGASFETAGFPLDALDPAYIRLWHDGQEIALEEVGTQDGSLDGQDEVRFYAPTPGNRWNTTDTYWFTVELTPGLRIQTRSVQPGTAPLRSTAFEPGVWHDNTVYDSTLPGQDGDHWFAADLRAGTGVNDPEESTTSASIKPKLPLADGISEITVYGSAKTPGNHTLAMRLTNTSQRVTQRWSGKGEWSETFKHTIEENDQSNTLAFQLELVNTGGIANVLPDSINWIVPVSLDFGQKGATFTGVEGMWRYQITNTPDGRMLYDVSNPQESVRLLLPDGTTTFEDGPTARTYVLTGPGTMHSPTVTGYNPVDIPQADVIYIAPQRFHTTLQPLVALRKAQGHTVTVVDVQDVYDRWGYGQVAPSAIRDFLRYAVATWQPAPIAVTLVGDGTTDPMNYSDKPKNHHIIPPYLADVDPWLGETACETCYAQLDGDDPLQTRDMLPDIALGRLPVTDASELAQVVNKIVRYETEEINTAQRSRIAYIADNYQEADGTTDSAGDFLTFSDESAASHPTDVVIERLYYDPSPTNTTAAWREPDAAEARKRTIALLNTGPAIVNFFGHSHYWQWAVTDHALDPEAWLLGFDDISTLQNANDLSVYLEMSCLTSAFHFHDYKREDLSALDERLLLYPNGGAVAVWGSTGLGVAFGHLEMQRGFYQALWQKMPARSLGELTNAGYTNLFFNGNCCQSAITIFALLGDPMTSPRVHTSNSNFVYLPLVLRR